MTDYDQHRVFVGGLSWDMSDRDLENEFRRFGKVIEAKVMLDRSTGRPRGFGFVTFAEKRGMDEAIERLHGRELDGRVVSVTKAQPKAVNGDRGFSYRDDYDNSGPPRGGRGGYGGHGGRSGGGAGRDNCFKCGQPGHWARDCPMGDEGGGGGRFSARDRYDSDSRDRYGGGGGPGYGGGGRYGGRERDRYSNRGYDRYDSSGYGRYGDRDGGHSSDRYGSGGPARYDGRYRDRAGPYERPSGGGGRSNYDDRY